MRTLYLTIIFAITALLSYGQERIITAQDLRNDLDSLYANINAIHPNMFAVNSKKNFEKEFNQIKKQINKPMTATEFYVMVAPLITKMRDGHTTLAFPGWAFGENDKKLFPLSVKVPDNSTLQVNKVFSDKIDIPVGAVIKSINKVSAKKLIAKTVEYINGEMDFYRLSKVPSWFTTICWAYYPWEKFDIVYTYKGKTHSTTVDGISYEEIHSNSNSKRETYADFSFKMTDGIGIIDFRSFSGMEAFEKFTDSTFHVLKERGIKNLIIDIRNNGGGDSSLGDTLFQYISHTPYRQFGKNTVKYSQQRVDCYKKMRANNQGFSSHWKDSDFEQFLYSEPVGTITTYPESEPHALQSNPLRYNGSVYLLTSHRTFSSAASFAGAFKYFKMGKIIGEETGDPLVCFGDIIYRELPNTKLSYIVSHKKFYQYGSTDKDMTHGTIPDYKVDADKAMDYVIDLIKTTL